ncbi:hypothetical protein FA95DRAFT_1556264 [Auriscalpium vulgare]|uniref:Uncharacterized protein n=1 Tax=Auriscalpium vulgare TaxID=40419 RepID=A0ACB8S0R7_9AGAM|nr:hypothetical protein FA95DRAFT_1556264 [Auriscalpium vulgare]
MLFSDRNSFSVHFGEPKDSLLLSEDASQLDVIENYFSMDAFRGDIPDFLLPQSVRRGSACLCTHYLSGSQTPLLAPSTWADMKIPQPSDVPTQDAVVLPATLLTAWENPHPFFDPDMPTSSRTSYAARRDAVGVEPWKVNTLPILPDLFAWNAGVEAERRASIASNSEKWDIAGSGWLDKDVLGPRHSANAHPSSAHNSDSSSSSDSDSDCESDDATASIPLMDRVLAPLPRRLPTPRPVQSPAFSESSSTADSRLHTPSPATDLLHHLPQSVTTNYYARSCSPSSESDESEYEDRAASRGRKRKMAQRSAHGRGKKSRASAMPSPSASEDFAAALAYTPSRASTPASRASSASPSADHAGKFRCPEAGCTQVCKTSGDLRRHLQSLAHRAPAFPCDRCGKNFTREDALKRHRVNVKGCATTRR